MTTHMQKISSISPSVSALSPFLSPLCRCIKHIIVHKFKPKKQQSKPTNKKTYNGWDIRQNYSASYFEAFSPKLFLNVLTLETSISFTDSEEPYAPFLTSYKPSDWTTGWLTKLMIDLVTLISYDPLLLKPKTQEYLRKTSLEKAASEPWLDMKCFYQLEGREDSWKKSQ